MLMEFALESWIPFSARRSANALSPKIFLTPVCASSKFPWMETTPVLSPFWVIICSSWKRLTPPFG